jgi:hypothetical protein
VTVNDVAERTVTVPSRLPISTDVTLAKFWPVTMIDEPPARGPVLGETLVMTGALEAKVKALARVALPLAVVTMTLLNPTALVVAVVALTLVAV